MTNIFLFLLELLRMKLKTLGVGLLRSFLKTLVIVGGVSFLTNIRYVSVTMLIVSLILLIE